VNNADAQMFALRQMLSTVITDHKKIILIV